MKIKWDRTIKSSLRVCILFRLEHYLPDSHRHAKKKKEPKVGQGSDSQPDRNKKYAVLLHPTQYLLIRFHVKDLVFTVHRENLEEMARYAEDVYYDFAIKLTHDAAQILKAAINGAKKVDEKLGNWDLVTEYDRKIEDVVIGQLKAKFPNHR
ncbi:hypothetical protein E2986_12306 [Frieseomelitta varia]|uniref:Uncharacterized protein n=1 Tax=Frieseomelitta varia TaxID=561572 RepID=A0A833RPN5_9HYME|nr:hypothetical protein E2986_12306 [Frieseomelitta varia]